MGRWILKFTLSQEHASEGIPLPYSKSILRRVKLPVMPVLKLDEDSFDTFHATE